MLALHRALASGWQVEALLAMFDEGGQRSRSHAIPPHLMQAQAEALGVALVIGRAGWADYEAVFTQQLRRFAAQGLTHGLFGDIDLQAHRDWCLKVCAATGLAAIHPLWHEARTDLFIPMYLMLLSWFFLYCYPIARWTLTLERRFAQGA